MSEDWWLREPIGEEDLDAVRRAEWKRIADFAETAARVRSFDDMTHRDVLDTLRQCISSGVVNSGEPAFECAQLSVRYEALSIIALAIRDPRLPAAASDAAGWVRDQFAERAGGHSDLVDVERRWGDPAFQAAGSAEEPGPGPLGKAEAAHAGDAAVEPRPVG